MSFFQGSSVWVYLLIFIGKIMEVTASTIRVVLITKGQRVAGALIALLEVSLWLVVTGTVLQGFQDDWLRSVVFILAFASGNYLGSWLEGKLAFGLASIQVIIPECEDSDVLTDLLRDMGFAITVLKGDGKDGKRELLIMHVKRKQISEATKTIKKHLENAVIVINDSKIIYGGFLYKGGR